MLSGGGVLLAPASSAPPLNNQFAERLRQVGAEFDREVRQSFAAAVQSVEGENRLLRGEVEWLQRQLEDERQQSAARLGLCAEFKRQLEEIQEAHKHEVEVREYWKRECESHEEQKSLLEAKVAALALAENEEAADTMAVNTRVARTTEAEASPRGGSLRPRLSEAIEGRSEVSSTTPLDVGDPAMVEQLLSLVEKSPNADELEPYLQNMPVEEVNLLLVAAVGRGTHDDQHESAITVVQRIVRMWVRRLLNFRRGAAVQAAISCGTAEALGVLLSLGGLPSRSREPSLKAGSLQGLDATEASLIDAGDELRLLRLCVQSGDAEKLAIILEHLQETGKRTPGPLREARSLAVGRGAADLSALLASHLVVELSMLGNTHYRQADFDGAMVLYEEAIECCHQGSAASADRTQDEPQDAQRHQRENLVRLHYNMARAAHRMDKWTQAREHLTKTLDLQPGYVNAYVLRAQAAMAAFDWEAAQADWDQLLRSHATASSLSCDNRCGQDSDVLSSWQKYREECARQLSMNHYEVLELPTHAGIDAVRRAYKDLARRWHPDKHEDKPKELKERAARKFGRIRQAYEVLSDESTKQAYDIAMPGTPKARMSTPETWSRAAAAPSSASGLRSASYPSPDHDVAARPCVEEIPRGRRRATVDAASMGGSPEDVFTMGARQNSWDSGFWDNNPWASGAAARYMEEEQGCRPTRVPTGGRIRSSLLKVRLAARDQWAQRWPSGTKMDASPPTDRHRVNLCRPEFGDGEAVAAETVETPLGRRKAQDWFAGF
mmetsp:Transcript_5175/g.12440  ORF Transcript_5175/g.12440 Transcript_5175/m.12440 type:complete len:780 (-) Transcript_5175:43-2382(-)